MPSTLITGTSSYERDGFIRERDSKLAVGGGDQIGMDLHSLAVTIAGFAQAAYGLHLAEDLLLDSFAYPLADYVTQMTSGACIECGTSRPLHTLGCDKSYDTYDFVATCRTFDNTPHILPRNAATTCQLFVSHGEHGLLPSTQKTGSHWPSLEACTNRRLCSEKPGARFAWVIALQKAVALWKSLAIPLRNADRLCSRLLRRLGHRGTGGSA